MTSFFVTDDDAGSSPAALSISEVSCHERSRRSVRVMDMVRQVIVFDAADLHAESAFWAGVLGGQVFKDDTWHSVIDAAGEWRIGAQLAPDHVPPGWPQGSPSKCISTCTSRIREPRTRRQSPSVPGCSSQLLISMPPRATRCTQTRPGIHFASAGDTRPERRLRRSSPTGISSNPLPGQHTPSNLTPGLPWSGWEN